jgi:hypothetical protein
MTLGTGSASAAYRWYAGNERDPGYGVSADIGAPSSLPYVPLRTASWVSTVPRSGDANSWVQTGWVIYANYAAPYSYVESVTNGQRTYYREYSSQGWSFARTYNINCTNTTSGIWEVFIQGTSRGTFGPVVAPQNVKATSEVQDNSSSTSGQVSASYTNVQYRGLSTWFNFGDYGQLVHWEQTPFWVGWTNEHQYATHGNGF